MFPLSPSNGTKPLSLCCLSAQSKSPKVSAQDLASLYKDKQNVTEAEFRMDYAKFKQDYQKAFGRKPGAAEKYDFSVSFCQKLNLSMTDISSKKGVFLVSVKPTDFVFSDYTESIVVQMNSQQSKTVVWDDPSALQSKAAMSGFFEVLADAALVDPD